MNGMTLIRHRRSVRTFDGRALTPSDAERLMQYAGSAQSPYGLPIEWRLLDAKAHGLSSPVIVGAEQYIAGKLRRAPHAEEAFGFVFERVVLYAEQLGLGTTCIAGTMNRAAFERAMDLGPDEVMPCVSPLGYPAAKPSLRESMMRRGIGADARMDASQLFFAGGFDSPLDPARAGDLAGALEMVRWAPSAVNKQPWRVVLREGAAHFYEKHARGYVDASGWDLQKVDLGIALCHYAYGLEQLGRAWTLTVADPGLATPPDTDYIATVR